MSSPVSTLSVAADALPAALGQFIRFSSDAVFVIGPAHEIVCWNGPMERLTGFMAEYALGKELASLLKPESPDPFKAALRQVETGEEQSLAGISFLLPGREIRHCQLQLFPVQATAKGPALVAGIINRSHIGRYTDRNNRVEQQLEESRLFAQKITEATPGLLLVLNLKTRQPEFANQGFTDLLGIPVPEIYALSGNGLLSRIAHPDDLPTVHAHLTALAGAGSSGIQEMKVRLRQRDSTHHWYLWRATILKRDSAGRPLLGLFVMQDIDDLKKSKYLLNSVLDQSLNMILAFEAVRGACGGITDFRFVYANATSQLYTKTEPGQIVGQLLSAYLHDAQAPERMQRYARVVSTGEPAYFEQLFDLESDRVWFLITAVKLGDGFVATFTDISERKAAEDKVRKNEALLTQAQQIANLGIWEWDIATGQVVWSEALYEMFGVEKNQPLNLNKYLSLLGADQKEKLGELMRQSLQTNEPISFPQQVTLPDGTVRHLVGKGRLFTDEFNRPLRVLGTAMDVTELIRMKQQLHDMEQLKLLGEAIPQIIWTATPTGHTNYVNQRWYEFTGLTETELLSGAWASLIHPEDRARTKSRWRRALVSKSILEIEFRMKRHDGHYRWLLGRALPMLDEEGNVLKWFGASTDIDDQKRAMDEMKVVQKALSHYNTELTNKNQALRQINSDLDNFIYTASHDLKAPISNIEGLLDLLQSEITIETEISTRVFGMMSKSINRFKETLKDLSDISKTERNLLDVPSLVNLPTLLDDIEADIEQLVRESKAIIRINFEVESLLFSRKNLRSIMYNLLSNALKYRSATRPPLIELATRVVQPGLVELAVKDNGLGLDEKSKVKAFEMFKRVHTHVEGSGVGLYIVKRIVENAGGRIEVESEEDKGTVFRVFLNQ